MLLIPSHLWAFRSGVGGPWLPGRGCWLLVKRLVMVIIDIGLAYGLSDFASALYFTAASFVAFFPGFKFPQDERLMKCGNGHKVAPYPLGSRAHVGTADLG